jgi:hypothetical protein
MILAPVVREKGRRRRAVASMGNLDRLVSASRSDERTIGRPGERVHFIGSMPSVVEDLFASIKMIAVLDCSPIAQRAIP